MAAVYISPAAQADFNAIVERLTAVAGNAVAVDHAERIRTSINRLVDFPGLGTPHSALGAETRAVSADPYAIF